MGYRCLNVHSNTLHITSTLRLTTFVGVKHVFYPPALWVLDPQKGMGMGYEGIMGFPPFPESGKASSYGL